MRCASSWRRVSSCASRPRRRAAEMRAAFAGGLVALVFASSGGSGGGYAVHRLVSDRAGHALHADPSLVNAWGLAASPTGPWWTANEARSSSTLYAGSGRKQLLDVTVEGRPTGVAF